MGLDTSAALIACAGGGLGAVAVWRFAQTAAANAINVPPAFPVSHAAGPASATQLAVQEKSSGATLFRNGE
ncbi:hypothetical protein [Hoeflea sp. AS16]|uniref:hypothetical protein n=1 Tax=unclassified Hoeflea TaxID=2614931 RepID=UPI00317848FA